MWWNSPSRGASGKAMSMLSLWTSNPTNRMLDLLLDRLLANLQGPGSLAAGCLGVALQAQ